MSDENDKVSKPISLKESFERAAREVDNSPPWLKAIYAQNREIERVLEARARGERDPE